MKNIATTTLLFLLLLAGCKTDKKETQPTTIKQELSILEKIANAHGYQHWKDVARIQFTFNVDRDSSHFERTWLWNTADHTVTMMTKKDTISYNRKAVDSTQIATDGGFVNDKFWLLAPFQLIWDQNSFTYTYAKNSKAPISKTPMHKLTTVYTNEGGYTPGDAYDYYFGEDYIIKEWVFRKQNQEAATMITTWEGYKTVKNLHVSTVHKRPDTDFTLYFSGVTVE